MKKANQFLDFMRLLDNKNKFALHVGMIAGITYAAFVPLYLFVYGFSLGAAFAGSAAIVMFTGTLLIRLEKALLGKTMILLAIVLYSGLFVIKYLPSESHANLYLIGIPPAVFSIYYMDQVKERVVAILISALSLYFLFISLVTEPTPIFDFNEAYASLSTGIYMAYSVIVTYLLFASSREIARYQKRLKLLANTDVLTGCGNRRRFFEDGEALFSKAQASGDTFALLILDLDHFKTINDSYGHPVGDKVLISTIDYLQKNLRKEDKLYRYGGEEFAILFRQISRMNLDRVSNQLREGLSKSPFTLSSQVSLRVTVSMGTTVYNSQYRDFDDMVKSADAALYKAKINGRNQTHAAI